MYNGYLYITDISNRSWVLCVYGHFVSGHFVSIASARKASWIQNVHHCFLCIHEINNKYVHEKFGNVKIGFSVLDYPYIAVESNSLRSLEICLLCIHKINNKYVHEKFGNVKIGLSILDYPNIAVERNSLRSF